MVISPSILTDTDEVVWLTANDIQTNETFKCRVGFGKVEKLIISKRFDKMNVGELIEIEVSGYDKHNNMFSTLEGFHFSWKTLNSINVQITKLSSEKRQISEKRTEVEKILFSDIVILKGLEPGIVNIIAELKEDGYNNLSSDQRKVYIIDPFIIFPEESLYILPKNSFNFKLKNINYENIKTFIKPGNYKNYKWEVQNSECGEINNNGGYLSAFIGNSTCKTQVIATDIRIDAFNTAYTQVNVVIPTSLDIGLLHISKEDSDYILNTKDLSDFKESKNYNDFDLRNQWKLVKGKYYLITNFLIYDIYQVRYTESFVKYLLDTSSLVKYIDILKCFNNNEFCVIYAKEITDSGKLLSTHTSNNINQTFNFTKSKSINIYSQISIQKYNQNEFILPFLGYKYDDEEHNLQIPSFNNIYSQELRLNINGGTGNYFIYSSNGDIIKVKENSLFGINIGETIIKVIDSYISYNIDQIKLKVVEVTDIEHLEERQEIEIANVFDLVSIGIWNNKIFTNCTSLISNIIFSHPNMNFVNEITKPNKHLSFFGIREFINENKKLIEDYMSFNGLDNKEYLDFSNYGLCSLKTYNYLFDKEDYVKYKQIFNYNHKATAKTITSTKSSIIHLFSQTIINYPIINDPFTHKILNSTHFKNNTFLIIPNSDITIKYSGGIKSWPELSDDYSEDIYFIDYIQGTTYSLSSSGLEKKLQILNYYKETYLKCKIGDFERNLVITNQNKKSVSLLRPGKSKLLFVIKCEFPKHFSFFFYKQHSIENNNFTMAMTNTEDKVFEIPQPAGIEYYIKKGSKEIIRIYGFDDNNNIFYNIQEMKGEWNNEGYYSLVDRDKMDDEMNYYYENEYLANYFEFEDKTIRILLFFNTNLLSHHMIINLIDYPYMQPNNSTIYLSVDNYYYIDVRQGSGDFVIEINDHSLSEYTYNPVDRKIQIIPRKEGLLYITLLDNKIGSNFKTHAVVHISPIKSIRLFGGGLLMVNETMQLNMHVYDTYDRLFSQEQISKMGISLDHYDMLFKFLKIDYDNVDHIANNFELRGFESNIFILNLSDKYKRIKSNSLKIELFEKLEIFPPYLLMIPGSSFSLSVTGGPKTDHNLIRTIEILDDNIASVEVNNLEVNAKIIGETKIIVKLSVKTDNNHLYKTEEDEIQSKYDSRVLCSEIVPVQVSFPEYVNILGAYNRKVYTYSTIRLLAALKLGKRTFTYGTGPLNFDWSINNPLIGKIKLYQEPEDECKKKDPQLKPQIQSIFSTRNNINLINSMGIFLQTFSQGKIEISLNVHINYPKPYQGKRPNVFTSSDTVTIDDNIWVEIAEFYENDPTKSGIYLLPHNIIHELQTNRNKNTLKYSLLQSSAHDIISLTDQGLIKTHDKQGIVQVLIDTKEKTNKPFIPVILPIYITDFYSLFLEKSFQLLEIEVGQVIELKIILQHEFGLSFSEKYEYFPITTCESHPNIAKSEIIQLNSILKIKSFQKGETNIILYSPIDRRIYDVFKVNVYESLSLPAQMNLNVGGRIKFLHKDENRRLYLLQDSEWISDDNTIIKIDNLNGEAIGLREGRVKVHLVTKDKKNIKVSTLINVSRIKKVDIDFSVLPKYFTDIKENVNYQTEYRLPLLFYINDQHEKLSMDKVDRLNLIEQNIKAKCISLNPSLFIAQVEHINNDINCIIKLRSDTETDEIKKNLQLKVIIETQGKTETDIHLYQTEFKLPYISSFKIKDENKNIVFSLNNRTHYIYADNFNDVTVQIEDESLVKYEVFNDKIKIFIPHSVVNPFTDLKLIIKNKFTSQKEYFFLNYTGDQEKETTFLFGLISYSKIIDFFTLCVFIAILYVLYYFISSDKTGVVEVPLSSSKAPLGSYNRSAFSMNKRN